MELLYFLDDGHCFSWLHIALGPNEFLGSHSYNKSFFSHSFFGESVVTWLWGDYSVGDAALNRFYVLHWLIAFLIVGVVVFHVIALHIVGSNNPSGIEPKDTRDTVSFSPFTTSKDLVGMLVFY